MIAVRALTKIASRSPRSSAEVELKGFSPGRFLGYIPDGRRDYPEPTDWDPEKAVVQGYRASAFVFSCVKMLAQAGSSVPWRVMDTDPDGNDRVSGQQEWARPIEYPNLRMSRKRVIFWAIANLALNGNALFKKVQVGGRTDELWPLFPTRCHPIPDPVEWIAGYRDYLPGGQVDYSVDEVIHAMIPDPLDPLWGTGMLQSTWKAVEGDAKASRWRSETLGNGGIPPGAFKDPNISSDEQAQKFADELTSRWRSAAQGGRPLVIGAGGEWIPFGMTSEDLENLESRKFTVAEICSAFGILPAMFSTDAATYSNLESAIRFMWTNGVKPLLDILSEEFTRSLLPRSLQDSGAWIDYDVSNVSAVHENMKPQSEAYSALVQHGVPPNEARTMVGLPGKEIQGGDEPLVNAALVPLRAQISMADAGGSQETIPTATIKPGQLVPNVEEGEDDDEPAS